MASAASILAGPCPGLGDQGRVSLLPPSSGGGGWLPPVAADSSLEEDVCFGLMSFVAPCSFTEVSLGGEAVCSTRLGSTGAGAEPGFSDSAGGCLGALAAAGSVFEADGGGVSDSALGFCASLGGAEAAD